MMREGFCKQCHLNTVAALVRTSRVQSQGSSRPERHSSPGMLYEGACLVRACVSEAQHCVKQNPGMRAAGKW
jgi:hypothetical protein